MSTQTIPYLTPEQYLEIERAAEMRSEYFGGVMYAMPGVSRAHSHIVTAATAELYNQLRGRDCCVAAMALRLFVQARNLYTYPDVLVTCGQDQYLDNRRDAITDAIFIIRVKSPLPRNDDYGEKFRFYRCLASFREYLVIAQIEVRAEHHVRQPDGSWLMREYSSRSDEIEIKAIGCKLRLESLYERVQFEAAS